MRPLTATLLTLLAVVLFASWFFTAHEKVQVERYVGLQGEARVNDHLAAERLTRALGYESESKPTLTPSEWLPDSADTLLVELSPTLATVGPERNAVFGWVDDGGHLVLLPPAETTASIDEFLGYFGLRLVHYEPQPEADADNDADEDAGESPTYDNEYDVHGNYGNLTVEVIEHAEGLQPAEVVRHDDETLVARRAYGDGYLTLLASAWLFENGSLENDDNARLYADVVVGGLEPGKVWLIYRTEFTPLWQVIWQAAPYLVLALGILLLLWLWRALPVFGPRIGDEAAPRRSIIEHIHASGIFVWRQRGAEHLVRGATDALIHEADARHPGISRQSPQRQAEIIATITGMPAQKIMDTLHGEPEPRPREFTHSMQKLQTIRKEL